MSRNNVLAEMSQVVEVSSGYYEVSGDLDFTSVLHLKQQGEALLEAGPAINRFELSDVNQCGSAGISLLLCWLRKARALHKDIYFLQVPPDLLSIIRVSDLDDVLPIAGAADTGTAASATPVSG